MTQAARAALTGLISRTVASARRTYGAGTIAAAHEGILVGLAIGVATPAYAKRILALVDVPGPYAGIVADHVAAYPIPDEEGIR